MELPDWPELVNQIVSLDRRTSRGTGRDSIDHPPGGHDDLASAVPGVVHYVIGIREMKAISFDLSDLARGRVGVPGYLPDDWVEGWRRDHQ